MNKNGKKNEEKVKKEKGIEEKEEVI